MGEKTLYKKTLYNPSCCDKNLLQVHQNLSHQCGLDSGVKKLEGFAPVALGPQFHGAKSLNTSKPALKARKICYFNHLLKCFAQLCLCSFHFFN